MSGQTAWEAYVADLIGDVRKLQDLMQATLSEAENRGSQLAATLDAAIKVYEREVEKFTNANGARIKAISDTEIRTQLAAARVEIQDAIRAELQRIEAAKSEAVRSAIRAEIARLTPREPGWLEKLLPAIMAGAAAGICVGLALKVF